MYAWAYRSSFNNNPALEGFRHNRGAALDVALNR